MSTIHQQASAIIEYARDHRRSVCTCDMQDDCAASHHRPGCRYRHFVEASVTLDELSTSKPLAWRLRKDGERYLITHSETEAEVCSKTGWAVTPVYAGPQSAQPERVWTDAARDVLAERSRQVSVEGWTLRHDDEHEIGELARAAACYAANATGYRLQSRINIWPWDREWWKPTTPRRDLVKAGALILAEIERIDRDPGDESIHHHVNGGDHA